MLGKQAKYTAFNNYKQASKIKKKEGSDFEEVHCSSA